MSAIDCSGSFVKNQHSIRNSTRKIVPFDQTISTLDSNVTQIDLFQCFKYTILLVSMLI